MKYVTCGLIWRSDLQLCLCVCLCVVRSDSCCEVCPWAVSQPVHRLAPAQRPADHSLPLPRQQRLQPGPVFRLQEEPVQHSWLRNHRGQDQNQQELLPQNPLPHALQRLASTCWRRVSFNPDNAAAFGGLFVSLMAPLTPWPISDGPSDSVTDQWCTRADKEMWQTAQNNRYQLWGCQHRSILLLSIKNEWWWDNFSTILRQWCWKTDCYQVYSATIAIYD